MIGKDMIKPALLMALCVYHEARGESPSGQRAIVHVIMNRVERREQSVEEVIYKKWQFSWTMDDIPDYPTDVAAFFKCAEAVQDALTERFYGFTLHGADHYFNPHKVSPEWAQDMKVVAEIGKHRFFKDA